MKHKSSQLHPDMPARGLIEMVSEALSAHVLEADVELPELAFTVIKALQLHNAGTGGGIWGPEQFRWQTPWMPGAPSWEDMQVMSRSLEEQQQP